MTLWRRIAHAVGWAGPPRASAESTREVDRHLAHALSAQLVDRLEARDTAQREVLGLQYDLDRLAGRRRR